MVDIQSTPGGATEASNNSLMMIESVVLEEENAETRITSGKADRICAQPTATLGTHATPHVEREYNTQRPQLSVHRKLEDSQAKDCEVCVEIEWLVIHILCI